MSARIKKNIILEVLLIHFLDKQSQNIWQSWEKAFDSEVSNLLWYVACLQQIWLKNAVSGPKVFLPRDWVASANDNEHQPF